MPLCWEFRSSFSWIVKRPKLLDIPQEVLSNTQESRDPWQASFCFQLYLPTGLGEALGEGMLAKTHTPHSEDSAIPMSMDGHRLIHTNGTLLLRAVKAEDSGYYTCTATNTGGFDTIIVNLLVQGEPCKAGGAQVGAGVEKG